METSPGIGERPSAPSPGLTLVPFGDLRDDSTTGEWPSPSRILPPTEHPTPISDISQDVVRGPELVSGRRVDVLSLIGDLLDAGLIGDNDASECIQFVVRTAENVSIMSDLLNARESFSGKARFLKLFVAGQTRAEWRGLTTPIPVIPGPTAVTPIVPTTILDWSSSNNSVSTPSGSLACENSATPLIFPKAIRLPVSAAVLPCIRETNALPKDSPDSMKSTQAGSSIEVSPPNALSLTRETTGCSQSTSPPKDAVGAFSVKRLPSQNDVMQPATV